MLYECIRDMKIKERWDRKNGKLVVKRKDFYERVILSLKEVKWRRERERRAGRRNGGMRRTQSQDQSNGVRESRYNKW